jgi:hypothetical protein
MDSCSHVATSRGESPQKREPNQGQTTRSSGFNDCISVLDQARPEVMPLDFLVMGANSLPSLPKLFFFLQFNVHEMKTQLLSTWLDAFGQSHPPVEPPLSSKYRTPPSPREASSRL